MGIEVRDIGIIGRFIRKPAEIKDDKPFHTPACYSWLMTGSGPLYMVEQTYYHLQEDGSLREIAWAQPIDDPENSLGLVDKSERSITDETLRDGYKIPCSNLKIVKT